MRRTKIVCTLGPATDNYATIKKLIKAGMNVARLNMSHGTHDEHAARIEMVKRAREELSTPVAIMADTKGPEIRVRTFEGGRIELAVGAGAGGQGGGGAAEPTVRRNETWQSWPD